MSWRLLVFMLAACASPPGDDVVGPYTGPIHRFVVDSIALPRTNMDARASADDLDGDQRVDNQLGQAIATLFGVGNITNHAADMIAAGAITSVVEIQADDLFADDTVSVRYLGAEDDEAVVAGGRFVDGEFAANRVRTTRVPGRTTLHLPVFVDADPSIVQLDAMQIDLVPAGTGFDALVAGTLEPTHVMVEAARGLIEMLRADPQSHPYVIAIFDKNVDGTVTPGEIAESSLMQSLLAPDLQIGKDSRPKLSIGFRLHLEPCPEGRCADPPAETCSDRVRDGDETDVDCGGSCRACAGGAACAAPRDCQSGICGGGICAAPTCSDGVHDGFETDVDCGWNCAPCTAGKRCRREADCASGDCTQNGRCA